MLYIKIIHFQGFTSKKHHCSCLKMSQSKYFMFLCKFCSSEIQRSISKQIISYLKEKVFFLKYNRRLVFSTNNAYQSQKRISDRICSAKINLGKRMLVVISVYAPTLKNSEQNLEIREELYEQLDTAISKVGTRNVVLLLGHFNARTGSSWKEFNEIMGKYGKGHINSSRRILLELPSKHELVISNTPFTQKHHGLHQNNMGCTRKTKQSQFPRCKAKKKSI